MRYNEKKASLAEVKEFARNILKRKKQICYDLKNGGASNATAYEGLAQTQGIVDVLDKIEETSAIINYKRFGTERPSNKQTCYIICRSDSGNLFETIATYIKGWCTPVEEFCNEELWEQSDLDYDEQSDTYYTPEGFYEGSTYAETRWKITDEVIAFAEILTNEQKSQIIASLIV